MSGQDVKILQRQGLGGVLGGVDSIVSGVGSGLTSAVGQAGSGLTSGLGAITSAVLPTPTLSATLTSISTSHSSSSSSSSTLTTSSSTSSASTTTSSSATPSSSASVFVSTSDGVQHTITAFVTPSASPSPSQGSGNSSSGFLNNKPLEGFVFALCGIVVLIVIFLGATFAMRRSRRKKMINEALSFEPTTTHGYVDDMERGLTEKRRHSFGSTRSAGTANGPPIGYPGGSGMPLQASYGYEREYPAYAPRSPNPAYDVSRAYGTSHVAGGGSAFDLNQAVPMNPSVIPSYIPPSQAHLQTIPRVPVRTLTPDSTLAAAKYEQ